MSIKTIQSAVVDVSSISDFTKECASKKVPFSAKEKATKIILKCFLIVDNIDFHDNIRIN